jgi:SAM-dependent methyltransferase
VGLPVEVTVLDVPREGEVRERLGLGMTTEIEARLRRTRSNVTGVVLQDMTKCDLPDGSFDGVVCVEVIEHVEEIEPFLDQVARVTRPGGWAYFTTPNGEWVTGEAARYNPDHVHHFRRAELDALLRRRFDRVDVRYAVRTGRLRVLGQMPFSWRRPLRTLVTIGANVMNRIQSRGLDHEPERTAHLVATAWRAAAQ